MNRGYGVFRKFAIFCIKFLFQTKKTAHFGLQFFSLLPRSFFFSKMLLLFLNRGHACCYVTMTLIATNKKRLASLIIYIYISKFSPLNSEIMDPSGTVLTPNVERGGRNTQFGPKTCRFFGDPRRFVAVAMLLLAYLD